MRRIFNAFTYATIHWSLTLTFVGSVGISAGLQTIQVGLLSFKSNKALAALPETEAERLQRRSLRRLFWTKAVVLTFTLLGGIGFGVGYALEDVYCNSTADFLGAGAAGTKCNWSGSAAGACEWSVSLLLLVLPPEHLADYDSHRFIAWGCDLYLLTLIWDFLPARKTYGFSRRSVARHGGVADLPVTMSEPAFVQPHADPFVFTRVRAHSGHGSFTSETTVGEPVPLPLSSEEHPWRKGY